MNIYERHQKELQECINNWDTECAHIHADDVLKEIALDAAMGKLPISEVVTLLAMYDEVDKWYA